MPDRVSLRRRLTWYVVIVMLTMTAMSGAGVYYGTTHEANEIFSASLVQTARILDGLVSRQSIETHRSQILEALERSARSRGQSGALGHEYEKKLFITILGDQGKVLLQSHSAPEISVDGIAEGFFEFESARKNWYAFSLRSSHDNLRIIVGERGDVREELIEYISRGVLIPMIVLLPIVLWALWQVVRIVMRPLEGLAEQVRRQDIRRLKMISAPGLPVEIRPLVVSLNQMIENLDAVYAREKRFVSDASHELRNPLAGLLVNVENAIEENSDPDVGDSLDDMRRSIDRLTHLVAQLLELSHYDNPLTSRQFEPVDLNLVCAQIVNNYQPKASVNHQTLNLTTTQECLVLGASALLNSLVSNLLDNAIKYGGESCCVRLSCTQSAEKVLLVVEDSGPGLDAETRDKVTERFYRASDTNSGGAGLGLSIVKSIADMHDAELTLSDSELGGLKITIEFPHR